MNKARFLVTIMFSVFVVQIAIFVIPPLLVDIAAEFEISVAVAGQLATITFAAWGLSAVLVGPMSDSFGRRPVAIAGLVLMTVGVTASAYAPNIYILLALRVITGLGGGMIPPNAAAAVADVVSQARIGLTVSVIMACNVISGAIGIPMIALLAEWGGWRLPFLIAGLSLAAGAALIWVWFPRDSGQQRVPFSFISRYRHLFSLGFFRAVVAVVVTQRIAYWGLFSYFAAYLIHAYDLTTGAVAVPLALVALGQAVGSLGAGFVTNSSIHTPLVAACSIAGGLCAVVVFSIEFGYWMDVAVAFVGIGFMSVAWPVMLTASTEVSGQSRATGAGIMALSNQCGGVGGGAFAGMLLAFTGFGGIGYLCIGASVASGLVMGLLMRRPARTAS